LTLLVEELVLFDVLLDIFPALVFWLKAKTDGNSNNTVIKINEKAPADAENNTRYFW